MKPVLTATRFGTTTSMFGVTGTFEPTVQLNDYCSSNDECFSGWCGDDSWQCYNTCDRLCTTGGLGEPCTVGGNCSSGYCTTEEYSYTSTCTDGQLSSPCDSNADCASGYCGKTLVDDWFWLGTCTLGVTGDACQTNAACTSPNICDTSNTYTCVDGSVGSSCVSSSGCSSHHCFGDICTAGAIAVDGCDSSDDCESRFCNTISGLCSSGVPGSACGGNSECDTYNCVSNVCSADLPFSITTGLVAYYPLNGDANDYSGTGNNGTWDGTENYLVGKVGQAGDFDGNSSINSMSNIGIVGAHDRTVAAWIKISPNATADLVISEWGYNTPGAISDFVAGSNGLLAFHRGWGWIDGSMNVTKGNWHFAVMTLNNGSTRFYLDNQSDPLAVETYGPDNPINTSDSPISIGVENYWSPTFYTGQIDELAIWNRALSPAEISNLYNGGAGMSIVTP